MEFSKVKLGQVIEFKNGKKRPKEEGIIPIYGGNGILGYTNVYNAKRNSIIIGRVGAYCGCVYKNDGECWISDNAILGIVKDENNYEFLYYVLKLLNLNNLRIGSSHPLMTQDILNNIDITLPPVDIQNKIAKILRDIDKKIELNNQMNDNLHEMVKKIYKEWFIDNKRELWKKEKLGNYLSVDRGLSYKGKYLTDRGTPMINLGNVMPNGVFRLEKNKYYSGEYKNKVVAQVGDIVVANTDMTQDRAVIGTPVIIPPVYEEKVIFSHHIYCLRNIKLSKMYIFYSLLTEEWNGIAGGNAIGTTVLALPKEVIENYMVTIPDNDILQEFEKFANTVQSKREEIMLENINLTRLRDTLLPKLMNGEICLNKIET